jgi:hypothetical protein
METQEPKKEVPKMQVNKNFIIIVLSIAFIIVSAIAIGEAHHNRGYERDFGGRHQFKGGMMMRDGRDGNFRGNPQDFQNQLPPAPIPGTSTAQ